MAGDNSQAQETFPVFDSKQELMEALQDPGYNPANLTELLRRLAATDTSNFGDPTYSTLR